MNNYAYDPWKNKSTAPNVEKTPAKHEKPEFKLHINERAINRDAVRKYINVIFYGIVAVACCFAILSGFIRCNELDIQISEKTKKLAELNSAGVTLQAEIERKQSREIIENYAVNVLGMQPVQDYQKNTIKIERKDTLIALEQDKDSGGLTDFIGKLFS